MDRWNRRFDHGFGRGRGRNPVQHPQRIGAARASIHDQGVVRGVGRDPDIFDTDDRAARSLAVVPMDPLQHSAASGDHLRQPATAGHPARRIAGDTERRDALGERARKLRDAAEAGCHARISRLTLTRLAWARQPYTLKNTVCFARLSGPSRETVVQVYTCALIRLSRGSIGTGVTAGSRYPGVLRHADVHRHPRL